MCLRCSVYSLLFGFDLISTHPVEQTGCDGSHPIGWGLPSLRRAVADQ